MTTTNETDLYNSLMDEPGNFLPIVCMTDIVDTEEKLLENLFLAILFQVRFVKKPKFNTGLIFSLLSNHLNRIQLKSFCNF